MAKTVELLPLTYDPEAFHMWADENFRRTVDAIATLKASDIGVGSFPSGGGFTFESIELRSTTGDPYIDFTRTPGTADYDVRIVNDVSRYLTFLPDETCVVRGMAVLDFPDTIRDNKIDLYGGSYLIGVRSSTLYFRSGGNTFAWETPPGSWAMRYGLEVNGTERGLNVQGNLQAGESYASGWFRSMTSGNGWYHQVHGGGIYMSDNTWIRTYGGKSFYSDNTIGANYVYTDNIMWLNDHPLRLRTSGDGNHQLQWVNIGANSDGPELAGYWMVQLYNITQDARFRLQNDGNAVLYDNGASWGMKAIPSGRATKEYVAPLPNGALTQIKALRPVSFKRKYIDSTPDFQEEYTVALEKYNKAIEDDTLENSEHPGKIKNAWDKIEAAKVRFGPGGRLHPDNIQTELGFIAEEIQEVVPEAVIPATESMSIAVMYGQITALLTKGLQELLTRVEKLEAKK